MSLFNPTRDQVREFFFGVWAKSRAGEPLTPLESMALAIVLEHPEYHEVLGDPERYRDREWTPEGGETNPFLHLSMHLAIEEQLSIDQPPGHPRGRAPLAAKHDSEHDARHAVMDCLAEQVWQAQRNGVAFDNAAYLDCLDATHRAAPDAALRHRAVSGTASARAPRLVQPRAEGDDLLARGEGMRSMLAALPLAAAARELREEARRVVVPLRVEAARGIVADDDVGRDRDREPREVRAVREVEVVEVEAVEGDGIEADRLDGAPRAPR